MRHASESLSHGGTASGLLLVALAATLLAWPETTSKPASLADLPMALLFAAIWEELLFRGTLQPAIASHPWGARRWLGIGSANLQTSLAFAAAHLWTHPGGLWPGYFAVSLLLGAVRDRTGSAAPCIVLHAAFNIAWWRLSSG
jgi:membrane protease YdiL (CAAX protease family)